MSGPTFPFSASSGDNTRAGTDYYGDTEPSSPSIGEIWAENSTITGKVQYWELTATADGDRWLGMDSIVHGMGFFEDDGTVITLNLGLAGTYAVRLHCLASPRQAGAEWRIKFRSARLRYGQSEAYPIHETFDLSPRADSLLEGSSAWYIIAGVRHYAPIIEKTSGAFSLSGNLSLEYKTVRGEPNISS